MDRDMKVLFQNVETDDHTDNYSVLTLCPFGDESSDNQLTFTGPMLNEVNKRALREFIRKSVDYGELMSTMKDFSDEADAIDSDYRERKNLLADDIVSRFIALMRYACRVGKGGDNEPE